MKKVKSVQKEKVQFWATPEQNKAITAAAKKAKMTRSDYLRAIIFE